MKQNLLEIVQRVAEFCNAGSVNSISDTRESMQIAKIVKESFEDLILRRDIVTGQKMLNLISVSDTDKPTILKCPEQILTIDTLKYKNAEGTLVEPVYIEPMDFFESTLHLDPTKDNIKTIEDFNGFVFNIITNKAPSKYTVIQVEDKEYVVFDSFDGDFENTVQGIHAIVYGHVMPEFRLEDDFVPALSTQQFPVLLSRAKVAAAKELKNQENDIEAERGRKQFIQVTQKARTQTRGSSLWTNRTKNSRR